MPEELSRAEKVARAEQLRAEISSNRLQAEHNAAIAAARNHDEALDAELVRLEAEAKDARQRAESSGSVNDALAAMNAAAASEAPVVTEADAEVLTPDFTVAEAEESVEPAVPVEAEKLATPATVAKKSGGNK